MMALILHILTDIYIMYVCYFTYLKRSDILRVNNHYLCYNSCTKLHNYVYLNMQIKHEPTLVVFRFVLLAYSFTATFWLCMKTNVKDYLLTSFGRKGACSILAAKQKNSAIRTEHRIIFCCLV